MRRTYKFTAGPAKKKKVTNEKLALWASVPVCYFAYLIFGAGIVMVALSLVAYVIVKVKLDARRRE